MVKSLEEVIERLQYKADNIKAKLEPSYFTECVDYLKSLPREESKCGRDYVEQTGKCPICIDCPHNCPLDKEQNDNLVDG